jgi:predicted RNA-binding Zn ribbon-like protein
MAKKSRNCAQNLPNDTTAKIAVNSLGCNESEGEIGEEAITPNEPEVETAGNSLETLSFVDFIELAELPVPSFDSVNLAGLAGAKQVLDVFAASRFGWLLAGLDFADEMNAVWSHCEALNLQFFLTALRRFLRDAVAESRPPDICIQVETSEAYRWIVGANGRLNPVAALDSPAARLMDRFKALVDGAEIARFRRCAYNKCGRIFYAENRRRRCCSKRCSNAVLQREWYRRHGKAAAYRKGVKP